MKHYRLAIIAGIISTIALVCSYYYYHSSMIQAQSHEKKYRAIMNTLSERASYRVRLDSFAEKWKSLGELAQEKRADVSYEIKLQPGDFDELNSKIISTYEHGFFFLKSAILESNSGGINLSVSGYKKGGPAQ